MELIQKRRIASLGSLLWAFCLGLLLVVLAAGTAESQTTYLVSVSTSGGSANSNCEYPAISGDGSSVSFATYANDMVTGDSNAEMDVFVRALPAGPTTRASLTGDEEEADGFSEHTSISTTGRFVAFTSEATNLVSGDTNGRWDIFVRDLLGEMTFRVSLGPGGVQANGSSSFPSISGDGSRVAFQSAATNLTADDTLGKSQIFVRDRNAGTTTLVSKSAGNAGNDHSVYASISGNGRYVAFQSRANNLSALDPQPYPDGREDVYVFDLDTATITLASLGLSGKGNGNSGGPSVADDGAVVFGSNSTNLVSGVSGDQIYLRAGGTTALVSKNTTTGEAGDGVSYDPYISPNGRYIAFTSAATNLVAGDEAGYYDVFVYDRNSNTLVRASVSSAGVEGNGHSGEPSVSDNGRAAFSSLARNLVTPGTWVTKNIFVRDLGGTPEAPSAAFTAAPTTGAAPMTVGFTDQSTGPITSWSWDFGDGSTSTVQNPYHVYAEPGNYSVTLTVTGPGSPPTDTETKINFVKIPFSVAPGPLDFGSVRIGSSKTLSVEITNHTSEAVYVTGLVTPLVYGQEAYRIVAPPALPYLLQPNGGNELTVQIEFKPPDISFWNGTLDVSTDSSTTPEFEVRLMGFGERTRALPWMAPLLLDE